MRISRRECLASHARSPGVRAQPNPRYPHWGPVAEPPHRQGARQNGVSFAIAGGSCKRRDRSAYPLRTSGAAPTEGRVSFFQSRLCSPVSVTSKYPQR